MAAVMGACRLTSEALWRGLATLRSTRAATPRPSDPNATARPGAASSMATAAARCSSSVQAHGASGGEGCGNLALLDRLCRAQASQVAIFVDELLDWNQRQLTQGPWQRMNLTAVSGRDAILDRHVADSLALLAVVEEMVAQVDGGEPTGAAAAAAGPLKIVDVGTGAGLPGLVLAIARPADWEVLLLDSLQKRCVFLDHVVKRAGLANVRVRRGRAEDLGRDPKLRDAHDVAVARAVANLSVLAELCLPFVKPGGFLVAAKAANPKEEVEAGTNAVHLLKAHVLSIKKLTLPGGSVERTAVICRKDEPTPAKYPRRAGIPNKKPL
eukprot:SM000073S21406  [mRNA]  locus=s73:4937:7056:- [translate_table: standard]